MSPLQILLPSKKYPRKSPPSKPVRYSLRPITDTPESVAGEVGSVPGWFGETRAKSPGLRERRFSSGS